MNIDDTSMMAKLHTDVCGRVSSMANSVRRVGVVMVLACAAVSAMASATAQDRSGFRKDDLQQQPRDERDRGDRNAQRQDMPRFERDRGGDEARRQQQDHTADRQRQSGRLTPDERRDLRRQINEAGVDLYPNTPRR